MAIDKLGLYQNALRLIGQRKLTSITEDREPRYLLDDVYDLDAIEYCLEIVEPVFARKTAKLAVSVVSTEHDLDNVFTLPADYISIVKVYSDPKLDHPISRFIIEGNTIACEHATIYLRYISDDAVSSFTNWSRSFAEVVSSYLARETCFKLAPTRYEEIAALFVDRVTTAKELDSERESEQRSSRTETTLTNDWRAIYNDALLIMGLDEISSNTDDSNRKAKLERALDAGIVAELLELSTWTFAATTTKSQYDPSIEPAWGYSRAHSKPADMHRIDGIFYDEYLQVPLKLYHDEGSRIYTDNDEFYLQYISDNWLINPSSWPTHFKRLVAGRMAKDAAQSLKKEGADINLAREEYKERESSSKSIDAQAAPPRKISVGKWISSRGLGRNNRDRP
jgi:hypothetical protein